MGSAISSSPTRSTRSCAASTCRHATVSTVIGTLNGNGVALGPLPAQLGPPTALALTPDARLLLASESALLIAH